MNIWNVIIAMFTVQVANATSSLEGSYLRADDGGSAKVRYFTLAFGMRFSNSHSLTIIRLIIIALPDLLTLLQRDLKFLPNGQFCMRDSWCDSGRCIIKRPMWLGLVICTDIPLVVVCDEWPLWNKYV